MSYFSQRNQAILNRVPQAIVLVYQFIAMLIFISVITRAGDWLRTPFIGGFFEHTMVLNGSDTSEENKSWAMYEQGFEVGDQLISVDGVPVVSSVQLNEILAVHMVNDTVDVIIQTTDGEDKSAVIPLVPFSSADRTAYFIIPAVLSLVFLVVSLLIFSLRRTEPAGRAFSIFTTSLAITVGGLFNLYTTHEFTYIWTLALGMVGGAFIDLGLGFPQETRAVIGRPYLRWIGYGVGFILFINAFGTLFNFNNPTAYITAWQVIYGFVGLSALFYFSMLFYRALASQSPVVKNQARTILIGSLLAFGPRLAWSSISQQAFSPYVLLFLIVFPFTLGYVVLRFRLLRTDYWVRQGMVYALLTIIVIVTYGLLVSGIALKTHMPSDSPYLVGGLVFLIAIFLDPVRTRLQQLVDSTFFRGQRATFSRELTTALDLDSISRIIRKQIWNRLSPETLHIYTYDVLNDQYIALADENGHPTSNIRFASTSPLVQYFQEENIPLYLDSVNLPTILKGDEARLSLLGARLLVGLQGEDIPVGWLALGSPISGDVFIPKDLEFLETISDQASVAISRVQTIANLERRVQEMNALSRVSQGVNVTLALDDILEFIFAQTSQIIPSTYFHIALYNKDANYFYHGFRVDDNERMESLENQPLSPSLGLDQEIIRKGRPIITQDYTRECQSSNIAPITDNILAWMGVPLITFEAIGALSIGSKDATVTYTRAQLDLLQTIADQTVGAIVKAQLLQETERRARQLTTLNEILRQLTSTLDQEPLLHNILENAVNILNCEAGALFIVDDQTGELIFSVSVGPIVIIVPGRNIPSGIGVVGQAIQTRQPVIENDAQFSNSHFLEIDKQTDFVFRSFLAVPMQIKNRVLGVIEVINRRDGLPFVYEDQNILTAFADQATVAIENARLLASTDQELEARVEELQVMGRIVRELNANLDVDRAMNTTLEWAMRQSSAEAGLIGMLEGKHIRVMAQKGYKELFIDPSNELLQLETPTIKKVVENGKPTQVSLISSGEEGVLPSARTQIIIPIRREANVIGLLLLESVNDLQEDLAFLSRLIDNAAIAIYNAQLYTDLQRTLLANEKLTELDKKKNEFLSIVSHELRTPLTPIQSCVQNLLTGAYGPITDKQRSRLEIALANTREEARLVNNLLDLARIEDGKEQLKLERINLAKIIADVVAIFGYYVENKGVELVNLVQASDELEILIDSVKIKQVITNLLSNAFKFTPNGGKIIVSLIGQVGKIEVLVMDTGTGIPLEEQEKIFDRFYQVDSTLTRNVGGTGIGLNIAKTYVELHGGQIWVESIPKEGATFHFTLPVKRVGDVDGQ